MYKKHVNSVLYMTRGHNIQGMNRPYFFVVNSPICMSLLFTCYILGTLMWKGFLLLAICGIFIFIPKLSLASLLRNHVNDCLIYSVF